MTMVFGKQVSDCLLFQKGFLVAAAAFGFGRLGLSLAGLRDSTVAWLR